ncbi:MAG: hypothetical protein QOF98_101, partial [Streptomyces sp.]|nr:hypothetical protein [Streptomyces sp.]
MGQLPDITAPIVKRERQETPHRAKRLKDDQVKELIKAYTAGATVYQLGGRFGIERRTVSNILKRNGVQTRWIRLTEKDVNEAERLYGQGLSL